MSFSNKRVLLFLGAGASVDAGLPSAVEVTRHLERFSSHTSRPSARIVENLFRLVQAEVASYRRVPASTIDFEAVLGALLDALEGRNLLTTKQISSFLATHFDRVDLERLVRDLVLYIRGLFLPLREVNYLDVLLHSVWAHHGSIATLNYDVSVERRHNELGRPLTTGFGSDGRWKGFQVEEGGTELFKLHGSVQWLRSAVNLDDPLSVLESLVFFSEPFTTSLHKTAAWVPHEGKGVRLLMNFGLAKEQLYVSPPFREIFARVRERLEEADVVVVAGYSFRDPAINRMLVESTKQKRAPLVVIDPQIAELVVTRPVVQALREFGTLIECPRRVREVLEGDVENWLGATLAAPPNHVTFPPGFRDRSEVNRAHDLAVELSLLEHYLSLLLVETEAGRPVAYGVLNCLVQSVERCLETYYQALIATGVSIPSRPAIHGVYSRNAVDVGRKGDNLATARASIQAVLRRLEGSEEPFAISSAEIRALYEEGVLEVNLRGIVEALREEGVDIH